MFRNKKRIERVEKSVYKLEEENRNLTTKLDCVEKNTKAFFEDFFVNTNNLVCPVCGDKVYLVIDDRYKQCVDRYKQCVDRYKKFMGLPDIQYIQDNGTFVYKIKCKNHCVGVRDESIFGAIEKFKSLKVGDEYEEAGTTL